VFLLFTPLLERDLSIKLAPFSYLVNLPDKVCNDQTKSVGEIKAVSKISVLLISSLSKIIKINKQYQSITINRLILEIDENRTITKTWVIDCSSIFNINQLIAID